MNPYIGITDFTNLEQVLKMSRVFAAHLPRGSNRKLHIGVMMSHKTLHNIPNRWQNVFPQKETYNGNVNPTGIRSPYEEGKRFAESLIMSYVRKYNLDAKIVRIFNTYGPYFSTNDTRVIPHFLNKARKNKPLPIAGDGKQTRTFCYVDDLVDSLILVMKKGKKGEIYNAGGDTEISILELAHLIKFVANSKSKLKFVKRPDHDHNGRLPDLTKLKSLGWNPTVGIYEGLKKTLG